MPRVERVLPFETLRREPALVTPIFTVERVWRRSPNTGQTHEFVNLATPDWVNIVPLTEDREVVLVRQERHGACNLSLEIPGGLVEPGEDPAAAALRELREETGYEAPEAVPLGWVHPNPAIMSNRCHLYFAPGARLVAEQEPDGREEIEVVTVPYDALGDLVRTGEITHSLVWCALHLLELRGYAKAR
jgi:8-oxo-dGTP pyrophosphatase MutT (NUDIX family)